ncbi:MAG: ankyrin repeat domain-containing protein, partial [Firmicutes bacterium]|nr:ankyrin repeat domain-containing protein [Bacillota bacterium]
MGFFKRLKKLLGFTKLSEITRTLDKKLMEKNINDWTDEKKLFLDNIVNEIVYTKYSDQKIKNLLLERVKYWAKRLNKSRNLKEVEISILCSLVIGSQVEISVKISNKLLFMLTQSCCNDNFLAYDGSADLLPFVRVLYLLENEKLIDEQHKNFLIKSYLILLANSKSLTDFENGLESLKGAFYDETDTFIKNLNNKDKNEIKIKHKLDDLSKLKKRKTDVDNEIEIVEENEQNILDSRNQNEAEIVENEIVEVEFEEKNFEKNDLVHESEVIAKEKQDALRYKGSVKKRNTDKLVEITDKLFETIKYDDLEDRKIAQTIKILSEEGVNINRKGKFRLTILMVSAKKGYKRVLNILLDNKEIDLNLRDNCGRTALDYAEGKEIIELLMEKGASTGNCLEFGRTPLMSVIADYNYDNGYAIINKLLRKPKIAKEINRKDYNGSTALMLAVIKCKEDPRYEQIVANLLKKQTKIDVNLQDNNKFTALDYCKSKGIKVLLLTTKDAFTGEDLALERTSLMSVLLNYPNDESLYPLLESKGIQTNLNKQDKNGYTVLMFAVLRSYEKIVEKLLNIQGIMVNIKCVHGRTALDLARTERIKELLYMKGALTSTDLITERTTLMSAILNYNGDKNKIVKALLNLPSTRLKLNKQDSQRNTALMYAVEINDEEIVAMLLKIEKINVNLQNIVGFTALNYAKNKTIEALLLEKGASARGDVESKKTKLMSAISEIENKDKIDKIAKELLKSEDVVDSINYQDESGDTALTYAVRANYKKVVEMILKQKNVDVNKINDLGFTPLDYSKSPEMIEVLLENGALKNEDLKRQRTPLMSLISNYKYSYKYSGVNENNIIGMVKNLLNLEHVAKTLNEKNKSGATALDYAENENIEIQKILLEKGARKGRYLEETDKTALMCAILDCGYKRDISGMYEIIEYLLGLENVKKTINNKDKNGYTALMLAAIGGYTKIVKMILKCENINVNEENAKGDTALVLAVRRNWEKTVKV